MKQERLVCSEWDKDAGRLIEKDSLGAWMMIMSVGLHTDCMFFTFPFIGFLFVGVWI